MIVYTLGTIFFPFDRAVSWLQDLLEQEVIDEPVLLQHGSTTPGISHPLLTCRVSLTRSEMYEALDQASLVISHAGQGSTRTLMKMGACFVLLPRLKCYGEHVDDHQLLFARAVEKFGIQHCTQIEQLVSFVKHRPSTLQDELFRAPSLAEYLVTRYSSLELPLQRQSLKLGETWSQRS